MDRLQLKGLSEFIAAVRARGVVKVALRVVDEVRPVRGEGTSVIVGPQRWVDVTAYDAGVVLATRIEGGAADDIEASLTGAGFTVRKTSDNIS